MQTLRYSLLLILSAGIAPVKAHCPSPIDASTGNSTSAQLSWDGNGESYDVYFGTTAPGDSQGNQAGKTFDPGELIDGETYYWRIDTLRTGESTATGDVWSFTVGAAEAGLYRMFLVF
jgi:hypothetical protein